MEARWGAFERASQTTRPTPKVNTDLFEAVREVVAPAVVPLVGGAARLFSDLFPESPSGLVPWRMRGLFLTSRRAYYGGWEDVVRYLEAVGEEATEENALLVERALSSTFSPAKPWRRTAWERQSPVKAKGFHQRNLKEERESDLKWARRVAAHETPTPLEEIVELPPKQHRDPRTFWESDLRALRVRSDIYRSLPPRQADVVWALTLYFDEKRPTTKVVAGHLGLSQATVREYRAAARRNPDLRRNTGV
jgi:hypothetical protein